MAGQKFRGTNNNYIDIAVRGTETLGIGVTYAIHAPTNTGYAVVRFVTRGEGVAPNGYTHFSYREKAQFLVPKTESEGEVVNGARLNKVLVKLFAPAVKHREFVTFADLFGVWPLLSGWITAQVTAEGFTLNVNLESEIKALLTPVNDDTPKDSVDLAFDAPDLAKQKTKAILAAEEQDEDEDEDTSGPIKKDWLN